MPVMDSIGLLKEIKGNKATANIPVILLTARAGEDSKMAGWEMGADDYLVKPFSAKELVARITAQIRMVKLRQSLEGNVRNLFLQSPAAIAVLQGPQHIFEFTNAVYLHLVGINDIVGKSMRQAFPELEGTGIYELLDQVYSTGEPFVANEMLVRLNKGNEQLEENYFNFVYQPSRDTDGKIQGVIMHGIEVTEQVMARKKVEESEEKYRTLFTSIDQGFALCEIVRNKEGKGIDFFVLEVNPVYEEQAGVSMEMVLGKTILQVFPALDKWWIETYTAVVDKQCPAVFEYYFEISHRWFEINAFPSKKDKFAILFSDITERKQAEEKIRESEKRFKNVLLQSPNIFLILEGFPELIITFANEPLFKSWGRTAAIFGKSLLEVLPELKDQAFSKLMQQVFETGETYYSGEEKTVIIKNGVSVDTYYIYVYQPIFDDTLKVTGITIMATDITEQVLARKKIKESEKRFSNLLMESPFAFAIVKGKDMVVSVANNAIKSVWGKGTDIEGKSFMSIMPEMKEQGFAVLLENVYTTGKPFYGHEQLVRLQRNGIWEDVYFNFIYQAYKEADETISGVTIIANEVTTQAMANKKIAASEQNVSRLFRQAPAIICVHRGPQHVYELSNDIHQQVIGNKDIVGKPVRQAMPELEGTGIYELLDQVYSTGAPYIGNEVPVNIDKGNGKLEEAYFSFVYQPTHNNEEKIDGILVHGVDVTEQVLARRKVEESEEKYRTLFNSIDEAVSTIDVIFDNESRATDFRYVENNPAFTKLTGLPEDVIGKRWLEFVPTIDPLVAGIFESVIRTGEAVRAENYVKELDKWYNTYFTLSGGAGSNRIICVYSDITERKQAEAKLKESEDRFRTMADASPVLIWTMDASGLSAYYNKTFLDFIGVSKSEDIADWGKIVHPEDIKVTFDTINSPITQRRSYALELRLLRADGQWRWVLAQGNPRMGVRNEFLGFVGSSVDISERKLFEIELIDAKILAENATKSKQQFLSNMSHEIRTPLNSILGFSNVLLKTEINAKQKEFLQAIKTSGNSLNMLINDILDLAKVDAGKMTFEKQPFEIRPFITLILHSFDLKIKENNLVLIKKYDSQIPSILLGDSLRLNQIILNLLSNAVKFTPHGKIILTVKLLHEDEEKVTLEFTITDSGIGIAADKLNSIFNLFE